MIGTMDNTYRSQRKRVFTVRRCPLRQLVGAWILFSTPALAVEVNGFLEPYRTVHVATTETGIMTELHVRVGDRIAQGEVVAQLDDDVHQLLLESARARMEAQGRLESAQAELRLRKYRLEKLNELVEKGHGRREEVERADADAEIAAAQVLDAKDDLLFRTLEHRRLEVELERRKIRSPLDGFVAENLKEVGEFVAPNDPEVVTIVQLDTLLAKFAMRRSHAKSLKPGQQVRLGFPQMLRDATGSVEEISPVIDAESGTVRVRVRLENSQGLYDGGQRCVLHLPDMEFDSDVGEGQPASDPVRRNFRRETTSPYSVSD